MRCVFLFLIVLLSVVCKLFSQEIDGRQAVLVTGGAGYIGSQTCKALAKNGYTPIAYDSLVTSDKRSVKWGPLVIGNIQDRALLDRVFKEYNPVAVIHLAALVSVDKSMKEPAKFYWDNVVGTLTLLDAVRDHQVPIFIFSSSAAIYGPHTDKIIVDEATKASPINSYGNTKLIGETMLRDFERAYGTRYVCFRFFNAAGADLDGDLGPDLTTASHFISRVIQTAAKKRPHLEVYGTDFSTPDGTGIRDYVHVMDLAQAHILALEYLLKGRDSAVINLGSGCGHSVKEVIDATQQITGNEIPVVYLGRREGDVPALIADSYLAKTLLGWEPHYSDLDTIIKST